MYGADMGVEEGTGKYIGGCRNDNNATMLKMLRWMSGVTKLDNIRDGRIRGTTKVREGSKGNEFEVVWTCDKKRCALCGKEGDGNESEK